MRQIRELVMERWCARVVFDGSVVTEMIRETTPGERALLQAITGLPVDDPGALDAYRLKQRKAAMQQAAEGASE